MSRCNNRTCLHFLGISKQVRRHHGGPQNLCWSTDLQHRHANQRGVQACGELTPTKGRHLVRPPWLACGQRTSGSHPGLRCSAIDWRSLYEQKGIDRVIALTGSGQVVYTMQVIRIRLLASITLLWNRPTYMSMSH
jgi:hypothetical protein